MGTVCGWLRWARAGLVLVMLAMPVWADEPAGGEFAGFRLGAAYAETGADFEPVPDGSLRVSLDAAGAERRLLYLSPASRIIGKIVRRREFVTAGEAKAWAETESARWLTALPAWQRLRAPVPFGRDGGAMVARLQHEELSLIVFYRVEAAGAHGSVELEYAAGSPERRAWRQRLVDERAADGR